MNLIFLIKKSDKSNYTNNIELQNKINIQQFNIGEIFSEYFHHLKYIIKIKSWLRRIY